MSTNMQIWDQVAKTDTRYTKAAEVNGQKITSLNGTAVVMKATEVFGPVGIGWGWRVVEERFDEGHEIFIGEGEKRSCIGREIGHTVKIVLWFMRGDQRGEIEQYGCTRYQYKTKYGMTTDGEAPKKSLTDAIKKALSMLGFNADVFLGMFDDNDYFQQRQEETAIEVAEDQAAAEELHKQERLEWLKSSLETMAGAVTLHELKTLNTRFVKSANARNETGFLRRIASAFEERKAHLESAQQSIEVAA
ncbi:Rad52/22 family double-strand break repair protein [Pseudomonas asplenii]|uniref:Rad52/22 family double-strand break repair protein n=1 Tax=Pseudomonas asplenii TaxID=53407 RepID=A0A0N0VI43_9PSED|nr:Rad52/Rad22 family DNA repair protein [Pseudomonas fuscovaginae]KPA87326.1 Rad52/22 family double-strand break repair protein [Pseudomonas fuscovaginae]